MKRSRCVGGLVLGMMLLAIAGWNQAGQPSDRAESQSVDSSPALPAASESSPPDVARQSLPVVLLDVSRIFETYPGFFKKMADLKADVERAAYQVHGERQSIHRKIDKSKSLVVDSDDHNAALQDILNQEANLAAGIEFCRYAFARREAAIYAETYIELEAACKEYAKTHGIGAILRFSGDTMDRNDPKGVLTHINRDVVWHDGRLDVTRDILDLMIARAKTEPSGDAPFRRRDGRTPTSEPTMEAPAPTDEAPAASPELDGRAAR